MHARLRLAITFIAGLITATVCDSRHLHADEPSAPLRWNRHVIDDAHQGADGVRLADFNADGLPDVVTGWEESGLVKLYLNPGPKLSRRPWPAVIVGNAKAPEDAVPIDIDADGRTDVVSSHEGKQRQLLVHWNNSDIEGGERRLLDKTAWQTERFAKLDGTMWMFATPLGKIGSRVAFVAGSKGPGASITLLIGPETPSRDLASWTTVPLREAGWIMSLRAIDMDEDGDLDVVFTDRKGERTGAAWLEQPDNPASHWKEHLIAGQGREVMFMSAGPDRCLIAMRDGAFLDSRRRQDAWQTLRIANPDNVFNGKAIEELPDQRIVLTANTAASPHKERPGIWIRGVTGGWSAIDETPAVKFDRMECVDLDGDGDLDVMTCEERQNLGVIWYENPGQATR